MFLILIIFSIVDGKYFFSDCTPIAATQTESCEVLISVFALFHLTFLFLIIISCR